MADCRRLSLRRAASGKPPSPEHFARNDHRWAGIGPWDSADLAGFLKALDTWIDDVDGWYRKASRELPAHG
ncbi:DUF7660 family protein [Streptomyces phaeofaciens]